MTKFITPAELSLMRKTLFILLFLAMLFFVACVNVKTYQMTAHQQESMKLSSREIQKQELNALSYREGAAGANGGKSGGGCGCN